MVGRAGEDVSLVTTTNYTGAVPFRPTCNTKEREATRMRIVTLRLSGFDRKEANRIRKAYTLNMDIYKAVEEVFTWRAHRLVWHCRDMFNAHAPHVARVANYRDVTVIMVDRSATERTYMVRSTVLPTI